MYGAKYCKNCKQIVMPTRTFNWLLFFVLTFFFLLPGIFYLCYYAVKDKICPICLCKNWGAKK